MAAPCIHLIILLLFALQYGGAINGSLLIVLTLVVNVNSVLIVSGRQSIKI
jgi:hypothetical protein